MSATIEAPEVEVPTISEEEGRRREILLRAVEVLDEKGWIIGSSGMYPDAYGGMCILGAVAHAAGSPLTAGGRYYHYTEPAELIGVRNPGTAFDWNDQQANGKKHVQQVLRRLANGMKWGDAIVG